jgi:hypothetical protein
VIGRRRRDRERIAATQEHEAAVRAELEAMLASARDLDAFEAISRDTVSPIVLECEEYLVMGVQNAFRLVETSRPPGKLKGWTGGLGAPLGPIAAGLGRINASYEVGPFELQVTDPADFRQRLMPEAGSFFITNHRAQYLGRARTGEWPFSKVVALQQIDNSPNHSTGERDGYFDIPTATVFHMRDERDVAGVAYPSPNAHLIRIRIDFAMAIQSNRLESFASTIEQQLETLTAPSR